MIRITSFAEKSDQASRFFVLTEAYAASPRPSGTGDPFLFLSTGAEAPAYFRSASPRRRRFYPPDVHPASRVLVVSVLKALRSFPPGAVITADVDGDQVKFEPRCLDKC